MVNRFINLSTYFQIAPSATIVAIHKEHENYFKNYEPASLPQQAVKFLSGSFMIACKMFKNVLVGRADPQEHEFHQKFWVTICHILKTIIAEKNKFIWLLRTYS